MNLAFVVQDKITNVAAELYNWVINKIKLTNTSPKIEIKNLLDLSILIRLVLGALRELKSSTLLINPLLLPIFKNLFFLSLKISSDDIVLK